MTLQLKSLYIGKPKQYVYKGKMYTSAISKNSKEQIYLTKDGFQEDGVADHRHHGGPDRAVCFYPVEHYSQWKREFGKDLLRPGFGENLSVAGMLEQDVCIGDIYKIGEATVQISQNRIPCATISQHNGIDSLLKRVIETGYTGYFARVLEAGCISLDADIHLLERPEKTATVLTVNELYFHNRDNQDLLQSVVEIASLAEVMREKFVKKLKITLDK